ncbi:MULTISPECIES: hypothetical protein [Calothrix]|uniref:Uncharacterized protein n=2 Tax=Calothrix TaxID=1186 RepID=A0ABR8AE06_9CYAN|nr:MULTISPECIES: hypothetical protein [Calothrix]MBD2197974.1 hypothetical protein [Calothrix parietina FACHB-288]MBD2226741.1 hypothetical protein [Calothrix anomala FACHB-343]
MPNAPSRRAAIPLHPQEDGVSRRLLINLIKSIGELSNRLDGVAAR